MTASLGGPRDVTFVVDPSMYGGAYLPPRLGVRVTVLARSRLLSHGDPDVSDELAGHLRGEGIDVLTAVKTERNRLEDPIHSLVFATGALGATLPRSRHRRREELLLRDGATYQRCRRNIPKQPGPMRRLSVTILAALALQIAGPTSAEAQVPQILQGRVADAQSMSPVVGAFVSQAGSQRGVLTDSLGMFALEMEPAYARAIRVVQLGYRELLTAIPEGGSGRVLNVLLVPDAIQLEGLTVLTERLANRRRGPYGVGEILTQAQLITASEGSGYELVRRIMPFVTLCDRQNSEALCLGGRRGIDGPRVVTVCIDGSVVPAELAETVLSGVDPRGLYLVEAYTRVGEVRMYTAGYMQRLIAEGMDLPPLSFECTGPRG